MLSFPSLYDFLVKCYLEYMNLQDVVIPAAIQLEVPILNKSAVCNNAFFSRKATCGLSDCIMKLQLSDGSSCDVAIAQLELFKSLFEKIGQLQ